MKTLCNGTALQTDDAIAQKFPQGWKVRCRNGSRPWFSVFPRTLGRPVSTKWAKTKREAVALMAECTK